MSVNQCPHINTGFPQSHQQAWPWIPTVLLPGTFIPGENISAGETQWTKPAGIWHSLTFPLPLLYSLYIHLLVNTMMALHKSLDFFLTMDDWAAHNLLQGAGSKKKTARFLIPLRSLPVSAEKCCMQKCEWWRKNIYESMFNRRTSLLVHSVLNTELNM